MMRDMHRNFGNSHWLREAELLRLGAKILLAQGAHSMAVQQIFWRIEEDKQRFLAGRIENRDRGGGDLIFAPFDKAAAFAKKKRRLLRKKLIGCPKR